MAEAQVTPTAWNTYWDELPPGYLHFPAEGEEAVRGLSHLVPLTPELTALDYGCGYGHAARPLAPRVGTLYIWDYSEPMRRFALSHLQDLPNVRLWDADEPSRFDLIWINSVVQYMTAASFAAVLKLLASRLQPRGQLVVSDLIPAKPSFASDLLSLARFSLRRGYFLTAFRRALALRQTYAKYEAECPLYHPPRAEVLRLGAEAGLHGEYQPWNVTHFRGRETVVFRLQPSTGGSGS